MRSSSLVAIAVAAVGLALGSPTEVRAWGDLHSAPEGWDFPLGAKKRGDRHECSQESTMCDDAYGYRYVRRPWYPYYNSGYWVSADEMRNRYRYSYTGPKYRYHPAWGRDKHDDGHAHIDHERKPLK